MGRIIIESDEGIAHILNRRHQMIILPLLQQLKKVTITISNHST